MKVENIIIVFMSISIVVSFGSYKIIEGRESYMPIELNAGLDFSPTSPLRTEVTNLLRKQILDGQISSGERLIEEEIAKLLDVSRMPVREALRILESEGLIHMVPRKGLFVAEYTEDDIVEFYTIRKALEVCAVNLVIDKISQEEITKLKKYCDKALNASLKNDTKEVCIWAAKFNEEIYNSCGMNRLKEQIKTTQNYLRTFRLLSFREPERTKNALEEHKKIILLIEAGDHEGAAKATSEHLDGALEAYIASWRQNKGKKY